MEAVTAGDCVEVMAGMEAASVDAVVTDPPYGLEFMGKEWDRLGGGGSGRTRGVEHEPTIESRDDSPQHRSAVRQPSYLKRCAVCGGNSSGKWGRCVCETPDFRERADLKRAMQDWHEAWAREAFRVLKPGGHLLAFGGTRTYHRLACAVEDAGFEVRDMIAWMHGQGFPKSLNVSKAIDKAAKAETPEAAEWDGWATALKPAFEPVVVARRPLIGTVVANVLAFGTGALNVDGCRIVTTPEDLERSNRKMSGDGDWRKVEATGAATFDITDPDGAVMNPSGRWPANVVLDEEWVPVLCLRDSLESGVWDLLSDWCDARNGDVPPMRGRDRRPAEPGESPEVLFAPVQAPLDERESARRGAPDEGPEALAGVAGEDAGVESCDGEVRLGQPVVEGGEVQGAGLLDGGAVGALAGGPHARGTDDREGAGLSAGTPDRDGADVGAVVDPLRGRPPHQRDQDGQPAGEPRGPRSADSPDDPRRDVSGASRVARPRVEVLLRDVPAPWLTYFDSTGDVARTGAAGLLDGQSGASRFFYCAKTSSRERNTGLPEGERSTHPTVKPIDLMRWLVRLVTPPGGIVLDPFAGSGTTGIAAALEGFEFIGVERDPEYVKIAEARLAWWAKHGGEGSTKDVLAAAKVRAKAEAEGQDTLL